ncbi:MAG TPA: NADH-quinone oxidoreductase subunit NuoH [Longimicrobiales bacterium]|nr:NADH-quinone oxidoreductase subunit NuoH [Longimicrobiales bacterium]
MHEVGALSPLAFLIASAAKVLGVFSIVMVVVAFLTLLERRLSAWIQDRLGPNRVGPFGLLQPLADGIKNILKEETYPAEASKFYFILAPMLSIMPALVAFAVIPFAAPLPTPWGLVDMIIADLPIGILFVFAMTGLGVYGIVMAGWASNNKYAFLGGMRAGAQMVSYEVAFGLSLIPVFFLAGNVTLTQIVWLQQGELGLWLAFPLGLSFFFFMVSAFAETNRLPFDMPEAESELVTGYHTEYSSMKFSMFFIAEYASMLTASALMATLFLGGWDIPFWSGDDMVVVAPGVVAGAQPAVWKTLLTFAAFAAKTGFFIVVYMWVRWTLPRFRYDQVMHLGWKVMLPSALAYVVLMAVSILVLDSLGLQFGLVYGLILTAVNLVASAIFFVIVDRDRVIVGGSHRQPLERRREMAASLAAHRRAAALAADAVPAEIHAEGAQLEELVGR